MSPTDRPTAKQPEHLRQLAARLGQSFAYPETRGQASEEIRRLRTASRSSTWATAASRCSKRSSDALSMRPSHCFPAGGFCPPIVHRPKKRLPARDAEWAGRRGNRSLAGTSRKRLKGLEPSTFCMASRRSSQLSYSRVASAV
jgi:hypothetical protein